MAAHTLKANIFHFRHGTAMENLDADGKRQMACARAVHLNGVRIHALGSSELPRAMESAALLGEGQEPEMRITDPDLGYKWADNDSILLSFQIPNVLPRTINDLFKVYPRAIAHRVVMQRRINTILQQLFFPNNAPAPVRPEELRNIVIVSHLYCVETIASNPEKLPLPEYGDGYRTEVRLMIDDEKAKPDPRFFYRSSLFLPCPV